MFLRPMCCMGPTWASVEDQRMRLYSHRERQLQQLTLFMGEDLASGGHEFRGFRYESVPMRLPQLG